MSRTSIDHTGYSTEGEVVKMDVTITGHRKGARVTGIVIEIDQLDPIKLREGRRVVVLTEEEFRALTEEAAYCPKCAREACTRCWTVHRGECL